MYTAAAAPLPASPPEYTRGTHGVPRGDFAKSTAMLFRSFRGLHSSDHPVSHHGYDGQPAHGHDPLASPDLQLPGTRLHSTSRPCFCPPHGHPGCNGHPAHGRCSLASPDPLLTGTSHCSASHPGHSPMHVLAPHVLRPLRFITGSARLAAPLRFPSPQAAATPPPSSGPLAFTLGAPIRTQGMCLPPCRRMTQHHPKKRRPKDYSPGGYGGKSPPPCDRPIPSWGYLSAYRHLGG